jgi:site-specific DNA-methyltransferase (adenine-specific)
MGYYYREETFDHPGQTSMDITNRVITSFSNPGETVLDCFMGTGTTGLSCVKYGRNFIGIEQEPKWFALSERRIHDAEQQPLLIGASA